MPSKPAGQRRPKQGRAKATREHILHTAARLFAERGIAATSMNRIANEAGVSIGTVYRYFPDRSVVAEELTGQLQENIEKRFTQRVFAIGDEPITELMVAMLEAAADEVVTNPGLVRALVSDVGWPNSFVPELGRRLRVVAKLLVIQILGPGDDHRYDTITTVLVNAGSVTVTTAVTLDLDHRKRNALFALTALGLAAWLETERQTSADKSFRGSGHALRTAEFTSLAPVPRPPSPRQERAKATREHILHTAAQLFAERGVAHTSTNRIAATADVSIGTVYRYFANRDVMVEELTQRMIENAEQRLRQSWLDRDGKTILELTSRTLEIIVNDVTPDAELLRALMAAVPFHRSGIPDFAPRLRQLATELIVQTLGPGDEQRYEAMSLALISTGFAAVLGTATVDMGQRGQTLEMFARAIAVACEAEIVAAANQLTN